MSPDSLAAALQSILDDPALLDVWASRLPEVKSIAADAREWERTYERLVSSAAPA